MRKLSILLATIFVSTGVALVYFFFEQFVENSIGFIWSDLFQTGTTRWLVFPVCITLSIVYFAAQHRFDPASEKKISKGLGNMPKPTFKNLIVVLFLGYLSLIAGASLGPEAILVPACMLVGGITGAKVFKDKKTTGLLSGMGFIALFAAFFNSFFTGMLGLLLISKQAKIKINIELVVLAALSSLTTVLVLKLLSGSAYTQAPSASYTFGLLGFAAILASFVGGYFYTYLLKASSELFEKLHHYMQTSNWISKALVASAGLSVLYLLGGVLVQFTGNEAVVPLLNQAEKLGVVGLAFLFVIKTLAIAWSKAMGYRGGLVFPSVFTGACLASIAYLAVPDTSFMLALGAAILGMIFSNSKVDILF